MHFSKILLAIFFSINCLNAQTQPFTKEDWVLDKDGDEILLLENKVLTKLNKAVATASSSVFTSGKDLEKSQVELLEALSKSNNFMDYSVKSGDTLRIIAKKLYNNENRWKEIFYLNKVSLSTSKLSVGMTLRVREPK